jgi:hypothetical protein
VLPKRNVAPDNRPAALPICNPPDPNGGPGGLDQPLSRKQVVMKHIAIKPMAVFAALVVSSNTAEPPG